MTALTDGFKDVFLAGVGAMALGAEKSKELVDQLIAKGEITVEQGKEINAELTQRVGAAADQAAATAQADAADFATTLKHDILEAQMAVMTPEEREQFAAKAAEIAARDNASRPEASSQAPQPADAVQEEADPYFNGMEGN